MIDGLTPPTTVVDKQTYTFHILFLWPKNNVCMDAQLSVHNNFQSTLSYNRLRLEKKLQIPSTSKFGKYILGYLESKLPYSNKKRSTIMHEGMFEPPKWKFELKKIQKYHVLHDSLMYIQIYEKLNCSNRSKI